MNFQVQFEREHGGRWLARDFRTPGSDGLRAAVETLALRAIADRVEAQEVGQTTISSATA